MIQKLTIEGISCNSCKANIETIFSKHNIEANVHVASKTVTIETKEYLSDTTLNLLFENTKYQLKNIDLREKNNAEQKKWWKTYQPVLLIFVYLTILAIIGGKTEKNFDCHLSMRLFMGGFFLIFSFFKMLDLQGFAKSYQSYDIVAKIFPSWGIFYVFIEIFLGLGYLTNIYPLAINSITFVVMTLSIIGVLQSVVNKKKIKCACLGTVFNLPMSTITIMEDGLMILMSGWMIFMH